MRVTGGCFCKKIRYTATIDPKTVTICHCTDCQINSGTAYGVVVGVIDEEFILEAGADDLNTGDPENYEVYTSIADLEQVRSFLEENSVPMQHSGIIWNPQNWIAIKDAQKAEQVIRLIEMLEDDDDVQRVYSNFDISFRFITSKFF